MISTRVRKASRQAETGMLHAMLGMVAVITIGASEARTAATPVG